MTPLTVEKLTRPPSGDKAMPVGLKHLPATLATSSPLMASQNRIVSSYEPVTTVLLALVSTAQVTECLCPFKWLRIAPVRASHTIAVLSSDADTKASSDEEA